MNWILTLILLFISCSQNDVKYNQVNTGTNKIESISNFNSYNNEIEIMLLFLWPKDLDMSKSPVVSSIISKSKTIMVDKQTYLKNRKYNDSLYTKANCECVLYYDCEDDSYEASDEEVLICEGIEFDIENNNSKVLSFFEKYERIKDELSAIGAYFYFIGVEKDIIDIGEADFINSKVLINEVRLDERIQEDVIVNIHFFEDIAEVKLNIFDKKLFGELDVIVTPYNLTFQGEIKSSDGMKGMMYWEDLR